MPLPRPRSLALAPSLGRILELALFLRVVAACAVEWQVRRAGSPHVCLFPDADYYWTLARTIRAGVPYEILEWGDIPHFALRTPGYPAFLAACQAVLGDRPLGARLVQAGLGTLSVWLVYRLVREVLGDDADRPLAGGDRGRERHWTVPLAAALLVAAHPYFAILSALLLSEAAFVPLMLTMLWALAAAANRTPEGSAARLLGLGLAAGAAGGLAVLVRPSWALFVPVLVAGLPAIARGPAGRGVAWRPAMIVGGATLLGAAIVMSPWWIRNAGIYGRFVPTAVWMGASLYDGLNPAATGASDMTFLGDPDIWPLDELGQDRLLTSRALAFAAGHPGRVLGLAVVKLGRYWSPWPNAAGIRSAWVAIGSTIVVVPIFAMSALGLWSRRRDPRCWVLLAGPLLYFCVLHLAFASSMRYRIPAEVPAMGLAALGVGSWLRRRAGEAGG
ncbi:4-amino-4-deoxy-L-arabinose transferase [Aquisphaera insulae]|uniref:4-amino-4-deoxy-L-arabinose transferase n=1 Tax=Aquisphaera insulae TaxID=2712864 RepID=UPI0013ED9CC5|nr:4-amino-4-deoxy-L-arabinose transferase [Aquisphaera insulae]